VGVLRAPPHRGEPVPATSAHDDGASLRIELLGGFRVAAGGHCIPEAAFRD
jgi:hypothetical protein